MTTLPAVTIQRTDLTLPAADIEATAGYARNEKAPATRAAYRSDFKMFREWGAGKGVSSLPASAATVAAFLAHEADRGSRAAGVCIIVQAYAQRIGLRAADFGAHSLRAGFLTSAARRGTSVFKMRDVSRHKSMDVLQAYVRDADLFRDHAGAGLL